MKKNLHYSLIAVLAILFTSCASSYKPIKPPSVSYIKTVEDSTITFSYQYRALRIAGNGKYARKEDKKGVKVVAIKITNHSDQPVTFNKNLKLYAGGQEIKPLDPLFAYKQLKQKSAIYLLYAPLTLLRLYFYSTDQYGNSTVTNSFPIGYAIGPGLVIRNMVVAGNANKRFLEELGKYSLINREIKPGETVYGLVCIQDFNYDPLSVKVKPYSPLGNGF